MCFPNHPNAITGESSATIGNPTTPGDKVDETTPAWVKAQGIQKRREDIAQRRANAGMADKPNSTDDVLEEARKRMGLKLLQQSNRRDALSNNGPSMYSLLK